MKKNLIKLKKQKKIVNFFIEKLNALKIDKNQIEQIDISANSKIRELEERIEFMQKQINESNDYLLKHVNAMPIEKKTYNDLLLTSKTHGFGAFIIEDDIYFAFHSSISKSRIYEISDDNIQINEARNPIKYVNKLQKTSVETFKKIYKVSEPIKMLESPRYGKNLKKDLAYCTLRALTTSVRKSDTLLEIKETLSEFEISIQTSLIVDEKIGVYLPAQARIMKNDVNDALVNDIIQGTEEMLENNSAKKELLDIIAEN